MKLKYLKLGITLLVAMILAAAPFFWAMATPVQAATIPTFSIVSVNTDKTVTIQTFNFPAHLSFVVRMGPFGTLGIGGTVVATTDSGNGGSFTATYNIPAGLVGSPQIAIRMDSTWGGFFAYNWFFNHTSSSGTGTPIPSTGGFSGIPTFSIVSVVTDKTVTIQTNNYPAHFNFVVRMGAFGSLGLGGTVVGTTDSGNGGAFTATYNIPASLQGSSRIAIRMDSSSGGFFAFNWFWNNTTGSSSATPVPSTGTTGFPTFSIVSVVKDTSVTIQGTNFPAHLKFDVRMGPFGTLGVGGTVVATTDSGNGGSLTATYNIPASLKGSARIAIRMDSTTGGFFAFNWFWNNSTGTTSTDPLPSTGGDYSGFPTFTIASVVHNQKVTISGVNFPPNQSFTVRLGAFGSLGLGGEVVGTTSSGEGGALSATYNIPASLQGSTQIAIRMDSPQGFFAFNWFWNNTWP